MNNKYSENVRKFVKLHYKSKSTHDLTELVNQAFKSSYTTAQILSLKNRMYLRSGFDTKFEKDYEPHNKGKKGYIHKNRSKTSFQKGHIPHNKGKKGYSAPGSEKGWFQKGILPKNTAAVGSESISGNDYIRVKTAMPNVWKFKHVLVYEKHFGAVPKGQIVIFLDGNNRNFSIENLALVSRKEHAVLNRKKLRDTNPHISKCGITLSKIIIEQGKRKKQLKSGGEKT